MTALRRQEAERWRKTWLATQLASSLTRDLLRRWNSWPSLQTDYSLDTNCMEAAGGSWAYLSSCFFKKNELNLEECFAAGCSCCQQPLGTSPDRCRSWARVLTRVSRARDHAEGSRKPRMVPFPELGLHRPRSLCCWGDPYFIPTGHHLAALDIELNSWKLLLLPTLKPSKNNVKHFLFLLENRNTVSVQKKLFWSVMLVISKAKYLKYSFCAIALPTA